VAALVIHNTLKPIKTSGVRVITQPNGRLYAYEYINISRNYKQLYPGITSLLHLEDGWVHHALGGLVEIYSADGLLQSSKDAKGYITTFNYNGDDKLESVVGPFGDTLTYHYGESGYLASITTPDGDVEYGYDTSGRLVNVTYPDNLTRKYHYEDSRFPNHLTGITDENGDRYATWSYDEEGRAILSEHADGAEQVKFAYNSDGTTTVTDAAGAERIYHFTVQQGQMKVDHIEGDRCATCSGGDIQAYTYDSNGFIASKTDWNGNTMTYTRDEQGRELSRTEGSGTPEARTVTTTWDTALNKPLVITEPERIIEYTYDTDGRLLSKQQRPHP
jgi:YD repeat-containing protein